MDGEPVWLCSVSHRSPRTGKIVGTFDWHKHDFRFAEGLAHQALTGVGDFTRERAFRMNITFCIHRAVSEAEKAMLPPAWGQAAGGMAGGPVQVLWSRGIEHKCASMPCHNPGHLVLNDLRPDLWVPSDCGTCGPCIARKAIASRIGWGSHARAQT